MENHIRRRESPGEPQGGSGTGASECNDGIIQNSGKNMDSTLSRNILCLLYHLVIRGFPSTVHGLCYNSVTTIVYRIMLHGRNIHTIYLLLYTYNNAILMAVGNDIHSDTGLPYGPRETRDCRILKCRGSHWYNKRAVNAP